MVKHEEVRKVALPSIDIGTLWDRSRSMIKGKTIHDLFSRMVSRNQGLYDKLSMTIKGEIYYG